MPDPDQALAQLLVQHGYLTPERLTEALQLRGSPPQKSLATVVVELGWVAPARLEPRARAAFRWSSNTRQASLHPMRHWPRLDSNMGRREFACFPPTRISVRRRRNPYESYS